MKTNRKIQVSIALASLFLLLQACTVGPNFTGREVDNSPQTWRFADTTDSLEGIAWWTIFNDTTLSMYIVEALQNNKDILSAAANIMKAQAALGFTKADMYPGITISGGANYGNFGGGIYTGQDGNFSWNVAPQLSWEIDFWGKFRRANEGARADLVSSYYGKRSIEVAIIAEVCKQYFLLLDYQTRLKIAQKTYDTRDSTTRIIQARFDKGIIPEIDLNQAQIQLAIAKSAIPQFVRLVAMTENGLSILLGKAPDSVATPMTLFDQELPDSIPVGLPSELLLRRPDIRQNMEQLHSQYAKVGVAQAMRFPSFTLSGAFGAATSALTGFNTIGAAYGVGASVFGPIFQWNKNTRRMQMEMYQAESMAHQFDQSAYLAFKEVEDQLISISTLKSELSAREDQYRAAVNAEQLSMERYDQGVTGYLEVLESQRQSFQAQLAYSEVYQKLLVAHIMLYKALGGGWTSEEERNQSIQDSTYYPLNLLPEEIREKVEKDYEKNQKRADKKAKREAKKEAKQKSKAKEE